MNRLTLTVLNILATCGLNAATAATVTIDASKQYQTIEGFGAFAQCNQFTNQAYTTFLHDDVGFTMIRLQVPHNFEPTNDNADPNVTDMTKFNMGSLERWTDAVNGVKRYADVKFIASLWTPPGWMKDFSRDPPTSCADGAGACGGHLRADMREELAEYLVAFYKAILQQTGVKLYGISIQNEAAFLEWYVSCVYTPEEYRDALKVVAARFEKEGIDVQFFGAEDMVEAVLVRTFSGTINRDTAAKRLYDVVAVHGYTDGVHPTPKSNGASTWGKVGLVAKNMGKKVWMTETSGFTQGDWSNAMNLAANIYLSLKYANLSAWCYWSDNECSSYGLLCNNAHTNLSLVAKNFYRYVRPGAVRIEATADDTNACVVAFNDKAAKTLSLVVYNEGGAMRLNLAGRDLPAQFTKYTTTAAKRCVSEGAVNATGISIDGSSVTTLVGSNYQPSVCVGSPGQAGSSVGGRAGLRGPGCAASYSLRGERAPGSRGACASGVCLRVAGGGRLAVSAGRGPVGRD